MSQTSDKAFDPLLLTLAQKNQYSALIAAVRLETTLKPELSLEERQRFLLVETMALAELGKIFEAKTLFQEVSQMPVQSSRIKNALKLVEFDLSQMKEGAAIE